MSAVFYCGCRHGQMGHMVWSSTKGYDGAGKVGPLGYLDSRRWQPDAPKTQGQALLTHVDGWTVLGIHDYTVDSRGNSHATFATEGTHTFDEMLALARRHYPDVTDRLGEVIEVETPSEPHD